MTDKKRKGCFITIRRQRGFIIYYPDWLVSSSSSSSTPFNYFRLLHSRSADYSMWRMNIIKSHTNYLFYGRIQTRARSRKNVTAALASLPFIMHNTAGESEMKKNSLSELNWTSEVWACWWKKPQWSLQLASAALQARIIKSTVAEWINFFVLYYCI